MNVISPIERDDLWRRRLVIPFYKVSEAAKYVRSNAETVTRWHRLGVMNGKKPREELSYLQLVELAVASAMRRGGIPLEEIKASRDYFAHQLRCEFPFASYHFKADGRRIVLDYQELEPDSGLGKLVYSDGQLGWTAVVESLLKEFEYEDEGLAIKWHVAGLKSEILIDPQVAFGSPQVRGAATWVLRDRYLNGESAPDLAEDFDLPVESVIDALKFENLEVDLGRPSLWVN